MTLSFILCQLLKHVVEIIRRGASWMWQTASNTETRNWIISVFSNILTLTPQVTLSFWQSPPLYLPTTGLRPYFSSFMFCWDVSFSSWIQNWALADFSSLKVFWTLLLIGFLVNSLLDAQACFMSSKLILLISSDNRRHLSRQSNELVSKMSPKIYLEQSVTKQVFLTEETQTSSILRLGRSGCLNISPALLIIGKDLRDLHKEFIMPRTVYLLGETFFSDCL